MKSNKIVYLIILTFVFLISLFLRADYIGTLSDGHHQFDTAQTKLYIENWFYEGLINNKLLSLWIPQSINYISFEDRQPYISYPIGPYLILYFIKLIFQNIETLKLIHYSSAFIHYLILILIFLFISNLKNFNVENKNLNTFALLSSVSYLFLPLPFYYHLMLFNFDTLIILPFVSIIFLEYFIRIKPEKNLFIIQSIIIFFSGFFDYFPIMISISLFIFRLFFPIKEKKSIFNFFQIFLPLSFPYLLHIYHLYYTDELYHLFKRFLTRTGISSFTSSKEQVYSSFIYNFWIKKLNVYLPFIILIIFLLLKNSFNKDNPIYKCMLIGFTSCILYSLSLQNYAANHDFAALKFYPMISICLFSIIPLMILELRKKNYKNYKNFTIESGLNYLSKLKIKKIIIFSILSLILLITADNTIRYAWLSKKEKPYRSLSGNIFKNIYFSQFPNIGISDQNLSKKIKEVSDFNDIFFSFTNFEINKSPPQKLSFSRKIVKKVLSISEFDNELASLPKKANVKILVDINNKCKNLFEDNNKMTFEDKVIIKITKKDLNLVKNCI